MLLRVSILKMLFVDYLLIWQHIKSGKEAMDGRIYCWDSCSWWTCAHFNWCIACHGSIRTTALLGLLFILLFVWFSVFCRWNNLYLPHCCSLLFKCGMLAQAFFYGISYQNLSLSYLCHCRLNSEVRMCHAQSGKNRSSVIRKTMTERSNTAAEKIRIVLFYSVVRAVWDSLNYDMFVYLSVDSHRGYPHVYVYIQYTAHTLHNTFQVTKKCK